MLLVMLKPGFLVSRVELPGVHTARQDSANTPSIYYRLTQIKINTLQIFIYVDNNSP